MAAAQHSGSKATADDDVFLAGLAPPARILTTKNAFGPSFLTGRSTSDEAVPRTPARATASGSQLPERNAAADAASTLLGFLASEAAAGTNPLRAPLVSRTATPGVSAAPSDGSRASITAGAGAVAVPQAPHGGSMSPGESSESVGSAAGPRGRDGARPLPDPGVPAPLTLPLASRLQVAPAAPKPNRPPIMLPASTVPAAPLTAGRRAAGVPAGAAAGAAAAGGAGGAAPGSAGASKGWELDDALLPDSSSLAGRSAEGGAGEVQVSGASGGYLPSFLRSSDAPQRAVLGGSNAEQSSDGIAVAALQPQQQQQQQLEQQLVPPTSDAERSSSTATSQLSTANARRPGQLPPAPALQPPPMTSGLAGALPAARVLFPSPAIPAALAAIGGGLNSSSPPTWESLSRCAGALGGTMTSGSSSADSNIPRASTAAQQQPAATTAGSSVTSAVVAHGALGGLLSRGLAGLGIAESSVDAGAPGADSAAAAAAAAASAVGAATLPPGVTPLGTGGARLLATVAPGAQQQGLVLGAAGAPAPLLQPQSDAAQGKSTAQLAVAAAPSAVLPPPPPPPPRLQPQRTTAPPTQAGADFDSQLAAAKQLAALQQELAEARLQLARLRQQSQEEHERHQEELARLRDEAEAVRSRASADIAAAREAAAKDVAAAEARASRAAALERDVASVQLQAQAAAIMQERDALASQRMSNDMLVSLAEQVRGAASATAERESRALAALERGSAERAAAAAARERLLQEREDGVATRERQLDALHVEASSALAVLEGRAAADKEAAAAQAGRLARESARLEALQAALLAEREEARLAVAMERAALDEARTARLREREALLAEATAERRRLGEEAATIARASEEARANLLDLKGRVVQHEAAAAAALRQAREEEARCTRAHEGLAAEQARIAAARDELRAASEALEGDRTQLQEWGTRLVTLTHEFDAAKAEIKAARSEIQAQRATLSSQAGALIVAQEQLDLQRRSMLTARVELDRQRVAIAEERAALNRERMVAGHSGWTRGSNAGTKVPVASTAQDEQAVPPARRQAHSAGGGSRRSSNGGGGHSASRVALRRLLAELQADEGMLRSPADRSRERATASAGGAGSAALRSQREFLSSLRRGEFATSLQCGSSTAVDAAACSVLRPALHRPAMTLQLVPPPPTTGCTSLITDGAGVLAALEQLAALVEMQRGRHQRQTPRTGAGIALSPNAASPTAKRAAISRASSHLSNLLELSTSGGDSASECGAASEGAQVTARADEADTEAAPRTVA